MHRPTQVKTYVHIEEADPAPCRFVLSILHPKETTWIRYSNDRRSPDHQTPRIQGSDRNRCSDKKLPCMNPKHTKEGDGNDCASTRRGNVAKQEEEEGNLASWNGKEGRRIHGRGTQHAFDSDPPWIELMDPSFLPHGTRDTGVVPSSSRPAEALSSRSRRGRRDLDSFSTESRPSVEMISIEGRGPRGLGCGIIEFLFHLVSIDESILFAFQLEEAHTYVRFVFASLSCFFEGSRGKDGRPSHVRGRWFRCEGMDRSLPLGRS